MPCMHGAQSHVNIIRGFIGIYHSIYPDGSIKKKNIAPSHASSNCFICIVNPTYLRLA